MRGRGGSRFVRCGTPCPGYDFDLTSAQFVNGEDITETEVVPNSFLQENAGRMKPEVLDRIETMRKKVNAKLAALSAS